MTSRDPRRCCNTAVQSAIIATAWLLVILTFSYYHLTNVGDLHHSETDERTRFQIFVVDVFFRILFSGVREHIGVGAQTKFTKYLTKAFGIGKYARLQW